MEFPKSQPNLSPDKLSRYFTNLLKGWARVNVQHHFSITQLGHTLPDASWKSLYHISAFKFCTWAIVHAPNSVVHNNMKFTHI